MAKTPKFPDEKLLEAVVKYADQHRGKIEATKLARWASENIEGLQGVEDRHFMRPEEKKDPKTGKIIKTIKLCTAKISELNAARNTIKVTGKHFDFEWEASPNSRMTNPGCPFLSGKAVWPGFNDLESRYPEIAKQWHPTKNKGVLPCEICYSSNKSFVWWYPYDDPVTGKHFDFEWEAKVNNRTLLGEDCPFIGNHKVWVGYNDLESRFPAIAAQWHPTKNKGLTPKDVVYGTPLLAWWHLLYVDPDTGEAFCFEWRAPVNIRTGVGTNNGHQTGCPYLAPNPKVWTGFNDLEKCYPEIATEFHPTKNRRHTPEKIYKAATKKYWWKCSRCGRVWYASVKERTGAGVMCSKCRKQLNYYI